MVFVVYSYASWFLLHLCLLIHWCNVVSGCSETAESQCGLTLSLKRSLAWQHWSLMIIWMCVCVCSYRLYAIWETVIDQMTDVNVILWLFGHLPWQNYGVLLSFVTMEYTKVQLYYHLLQSPYYHSLYQYCTGNITVIFFRVSISFCTFHTVIPCFRTWQLIMVLYYS